MRSVTHTMAQQYDEEEDTADEGEVVAKKKMKKMKATSSTTTTTTVFEKDGNDGNDRSENEEDLQVGRSTSTSTSKHRHNTLIMSQSQCSQNSASASQKITANILAGMKGSHASNSSSTSLSKGRKSGPVLMNDDSD